MEDFLSHANQNNSDIYCHKNADGNWDVTINGTPTTFEIAKIGDKWMVVNNGKIIIRGENDVRGWVLSQSQLPTLTSDASLWHAIGKLADVVHEIAAKR